MSRERIVAIGLLRQSDIDLLGAQFTRLWPVEDTPGFGELLDAIDQADRELTRDDKATPDHGETHMSLNQPRD